MQELVLKLREKLEKIVKRNNAPGMLFSGGLDTSILVSLNPSLKAITISLESFGEDIRYAQLVAKDLKLRHYHKTVDVDEAMNSIPTVIKILKSFDPAIPNDLVVYFGLKLAKEMGIKEIMTGDGADELFAGYDFMKNIKNLDEYMKRIASSMSFSSNKLGDFFKIKIRQPYLDRELIDFALNIPVEFKIREENGKFRGKWILRKAFEDALPREIIWQSKRPLEYGSGMSKIREIITKRVSDEAFKRKTKLYPIKFMNKEHLYYYEIYKREVGEIPKPENNQRACPGCGAGVKDKAFHCRVCGWAEPLK
jgi:asparagine synthase (glutamine-hydrolysing)